MQQFTTYTETLEYLYAQLPMFHRIGAAAYKADLTNTLAICEFLDHPEKKFKSVHVAGTNGKGSTSHMLAAILQKAGYKTGLYTSPHLKDFRERIRINGKMIPEENVTMFVERHKARFENIKPSFFEWTVGLAFDYFANEKVDIAVIETGLGGRLDSTNVIVPELSIITNIGKDHMNLLGDTIQKIAEEKAGIIKKNVPVVIGQTLPEVKDIFLQRAQENGSSIEFADQNYSAECVQAGKNLQLKISKSMDPGFHFYNLDLQGFYQQHNLLSVLQSVEVLKKNRWVIEQNQIETGLKNVVALTGLQGRWQEINTSPLTVADVGHNEDGIRGVLDCIRHTPHRSLHIVLGMVSDKDISGMLDLLPVSAHYYFCSASIPRSMDAEDLRVRASAFGLKGQAYKKVDEALKSARSQAGKDDLVVVTGSTFVVGEIM